MTYNIFTFMESDDYDKNNFGFAEAPDEIDPIDIYQGCPLEDEWKAPVFELPDGKFADLLSNDCGWILCSEKLKSCIDGNAVNASDLKWFPASVNNGELAVPYYVLLIDRYLEDVVNIEKSRKLVDGKVYLPHFIYAKIKHLDLFTTEDNPSDIFISERLKKIIEQGHFSGVGFNDWYAS